jgi:hypothetical protein
MSLLVPRAIFAGIRAMRISLSLDPEKVRIQKELSVQKLRRDGGELPIVSRKRTFTVKYRGFESTEIEQFFFGKVDREGKKAVEF